MHQRTKLQGTIDEHRSPIFNCFLIYYERIQSLAKLGKGKGKGKGSKNHSRDPDDHAPDSSKGWLSRKREGNQTFFSLWPELSNDSRKSWRRQHIQTSLLLTLPFEIREEIFRLVIGMELLHLVDLKSRPGYIRCSAKHDETGLFWEQKTCNRNCASPLWSLASYRSTPTFEASSGFPALLLTCRQNYSQGVGLLYSSNVFEAEYPETLVSLARSIRPNLLGSIRFLQVSGRARVLRIQPQPGVDWSETYRFHPQPVADKSGIDKDWDEMWEVICNQMKSLRSLEVKLRVQLHAQVNRPDGWGKKAYALLREWMEMPVENLRGMKHFRLTIEAASTNDRLISFQEKLQVLVCSSTPKGTPDKFPELYTRIDLTEP